MTDDGPCRCWVTNHALGHEGHCCFTHDGKWRDDEDICHGDDVVAAARNNTN